MSNPQNQKPWKAEYAKSGRSSCRTCKSPIASETLRLGKMVQSTKFDGLMPVISSSFLFLLRYTSLSVNVIVLVRHAIVFHFMHFLCFLHVMMNHRVLFFKFSRGFFKKTL